MLNLDSPANEQSWFSPPSDFTFTRRDVHVWWANLDLPSEIIQELEKTLSERELTRARRFAFQHDRSRFIVSHWILSQILGNYLNTEPAQLEFGYQVWGKPYLSGKLEKSSMRFNFSHSRNLALYTIAHRREVGIGIECIIPHTDLDRIASKYFSTNEYYLLLSPHHAFLTFERVYCNIFK